MPNPGEALTEPEPSQKERSPGQFHPRPGNAPSETTALAEPYMLTIQEGARSMRRQGPRPPSPKHSRFLRSDPVADSLRPNCLDAEKGWWGFRSGGFFVCKGHVSSAPSILLAEEEYARVSNSPHFRFSGSSSRIFRHLCV